MGNEADSARSVLGPMLGDLVTTVIEQFKEGPRRFWIFVEYRRANWGPSVYQICSDKIVFLDYWAMRRDTVAVIGRWADEHQSWFDLELNIDGDQFTASFDYNIEDQNIEVQEGDDPGPDRRQVAIERKFGNMQVVYPPHPTTEEVLRRLGGASFEL